MSAAHTPGPWHVDTWSGALVRVDGHHTSGTHCAVWAGDDLLIAPTGIVGTPESAENAALIAKAPIAPKLAEALRATTAHLRRLSDDNQSSPYVDMLIADAVAALREWDAQ